MKYSSTSCRTNFFVGKPYPSPVPALSHPCPSPVPALSHPYPSPIPSRGSAAPCRPRVALPAVSPPCPPPLCSGCPSAGDTRVTRYPPGVAAGASWGDAVPWGARGQPGGAGAAGVGPGAVWCPQWWGEEGDCTQPVHTHTPCSSCALPGGKAAQGFIPALCTALGTHGNAGTEQGHAGVHRGVVQTQVFLDNLELYPGLDLCPLSLGCPGSGHLRKVVLIQHFHLQWELIIFTVIND